MAGKGNRIQAVAKKAMDMEMKGLMIEVHPSPDQALTDANQQLTAEDFQKMMSSLIFRSKTGNPEFENKLTALRSLIDEADDELIQVLSKRMSLVAQIGEYKKDNNITILQIKRWNEIICMRIKKARELGLSKEFVQKLLEILHDESIQIQTDILNRKK